MTLGPVVPAEYAGSCSIEGDPIEPGQLIRRTHLGAWAHAACVELLVDDGALWREGEL